MLFIQIIELYLYNKIKQIEIMTTSKFNIVKETEKALQVELTVIVNRGTEIQWSFWMPKSVVKIIDNTLEVPQWVVGPKTMVINGFVDFAK